MLKFPLFLGKKWDFAFEGKIGDGMHAMFFFSHKVDSFKKVAVQAGVFDAFEITCRLIISGTKKGILVYKEDMFHYWYAPKVKYFVKTDDIDPIELVEYKVK